MGPWTLIRRGLWFHRRTHLGVALGAAVGAAVLIGALAVGDSLRGSLRQQALARLGQVQAALTSPDRHFRAALADSLGAELRCDAAAVLSAAGVAERQDRAARAGNVQVLGVDTRFWGLFPTGVLLDGNEDDVVVLNERLAGQLRAAVGDTVILRVPKPNLLPIDTPLSERSGKSVFFRLTVKAVAGDEQFGRFSLQSGQVPPLTVFVPIRMFQEKLDLSGRANMILAGEARIVPPLTGSPSGPDLPAKADAALAKALTLDDMELYWQDVPSKGLGELRSRRVFIDPPVEAAAGPIPGAIGVLTYFVNTLQVRDCNTPYSMVTAMALLRDPADPTAPGRDLIPIRSTHMMPAGIALNSWEANDLGATPGDELEMTYFAVGPLGRLEERTSRFQVAGPPLPVESLDPQLMPDFPGLAEAKECRDWDPGVPIDVGRIRKKDEDYWRRYRGTPKAIVSMQDAQKTWGNRFGRLTAIRFPDTVDPNAVRAAIRKGVPPASLGLVFRPVREQALAAADQSMDFGSIFLGMSIFLVASSLLLTGLLFGLSVRQRAAEMGTLLAVGFTPLRVQALLLGEGAILALIGSTVGAACALPYVGALLRALQRFLAPAVGNMSFTLHVSPLSAGIGIGSSVLMAMGTMWLVLRRQLKTSARELLATEASGPDLRVSRGAGARWAAGVSAVAVLGAVAIGALFGPRGGPQAAGAFFGAGALLLTAGVALAFVALARRARSATAPAASIASLAWSGAARRIARSLAVVGMLACGTFLVVAVGANRRGLPPDMSSRTSGTGGFALLARTSSPVRGDLTVPKGRATPAVSARELDGGAIVPLRLRPGDEASCLNLNRPQQPAVWGADPNLLAGRFAFGGFAPGCDAKAGWLLLNQPQPDGAVAAIADENTLEWALGIGVGDILEDTDEQGRPFRIRIVASLAGSVLQGALIISEEQFVRLFPSSGGYRLFLLDAGRRPEGQLAGELSADRSLQEAGLELVPTAERLAQFNVVENAYISMFLLLGGLGVLLGTAGLGLVILRNVFERRGELAVLLAVGFSRGRLLRLVLWEHWGLLGMGLACGIVSGVAAVGPALRGGGAAVPWAALAVAVGAIAAGGVIWTLAAAAIAVRGPLAGALRNE